jgi:Na+/melibiose symporter-like transporter
MEPDRPVSDTLHATVYKAMIGLAIVLVLSIWSLVGTESENLARAVITALVFFAVLIPTAVWWTWRRHQSRAALQRDAESFKDWESDEFVAWQDRMTGRAAAIQVLLPLAAVSLGMMVFAILDRVLA